MDVERLFLTRSAQLLGELGQNLDGGAVDAIAAFGEDLETLGDVQTVAWHWCTRYERAAIRESIPIQVAEALMTLMADDSVLAHTACGVLAILLRWIELLGRGKEVARLRHRLPSKSLGSFLEAYALAQLRLLTRIAPALPSTARRDACWEMFDGLMLLRTARVHPELLDALEFAWRVIEEGDDAVAAVEIGR